MTDKTTEPQQLTRDQFMSGFFAALRLIHGKTIRAKTSEFHSAFHKALSTSSIPTLKNIAESTGYSYDPLYGTSGWLDKGIAEATRDLVIERPLSIGHWNDTIICFNLGEAKQHIDELELREKFLTFANEFVNGLCVSANYNNFFPLFMAGVFVSGGKYWAVPRTELLPAFRFALTTTRFPVPYGYRPEDISDNALFNWLHNGLAHLRQIELIESNSNILICDYRIRMTQETAETALRASNTRREFVDLGKNFLNHIAAIPSEFGSRWGIQPGWTASTDTR